MTRALARGKRLVHDRTMVRSASFALIASLATWGCSADGGASPSSAPAVDAGRTDASSDDTGTVVVDSGAADEGLSFDADLEAGPQTYPVRKIPGLASITYYERSGGTEPTAYTFTVDGPEMTTKIATLDDANHDIKGVSTELYDVYYSNEAGEFELDGRYLTISGVFLHALPAGGGLNLAEIVLNYTGGTKEFGNYVASSVALGDNAAPATVDNCIDGDLQTHTTMGNTVGAGDGRLRITLGFKSSSGPPK